MTLPRDAATPGSEAPLPDAGTRSPAVRTENLAIVFTDIVGYTARTSRQTREENARLLAEHDRLLLPLVRAFGGRRVKSIGDALLLTFRSPTDSVLCGMAMQDRLARHAGEQPGAERLVIRVAINLGEVRVERGDDLVNDPLTDEDAETIVLAARLSGRTVAFVAQVFFLELPSDHSALKDYIERWTFQTKLLEAEKRFDAETKAAHS